MFSNNFICLTVFSDVLNHDNTCCIQLKNLTSKVLFALSINFFNAVFNRITGRLQELTTSTEESPDCTDLELIQYINVDVVKLTRLLNGIFFILFLLLILIEFISYSA